MLARARQRVGDFALDWGAPILLGLTTAAIVWTIWYITKAPCTTVAAVNGLCNPGVAARFINVEILLQSGGAALAVGALKGGYDRYMLRNMLNREREALNQEREAREQEREAREQEREALNQELAEERRRANEAQAMVTEMFNEFREELRQDAVRRQQEERERQEWRRREEEERREERRVFVATQQALLEAVARLMQQSNGHTENRSD